MTDNGEGAKVVRLGDIVQEFELEVLRGGTDYEDAPVRTFDVNRPGLPLSGFFEHFDTERLLVIGLTETTYLKGMDTQLRGERFDRLLSYPVPALILTRGLEPAPECLEMAEKHDRTILRSNQRTSEFISSLIGSLYNRLAPQITRSGVMMEIYGEGVLFQGESGVGKSEVAIELLKRGHRLIADDAVELRRVSDRSIVGSSPDIDVSRLLGMGAIKMSQQIDMVVNLEPWDDNAVYDRFGLESIHTEIMGIKLPAVTIPVKPGRNLASIVEVAAMNNRNRKMGHNAALELTHRMDRHFQKIQEGGE